MLFSNNRPSESWQAVLKFISQCPVCGAKYEAEQAKLYAQKEKAKLVHITCGQCRGYFMAMVLEMGHGLSSVGTVTDLSFEDAVRLNNAPPLTLDEVIEAHEFIHSSQLSF